MQVRRKCRLLGWCAIGALLLAMAVVFTVTFAPVLSNQARVCHLTQSAELADTAVASGGCG